MIAYIDTSVVIPFIIGEDITIRHALNFPTAISSELLEIEAARTLSRLYLQGEMDSSQCTSALVRLRSLMDSIELEKLSSKVKARAKKDFPTVIATLDALHLSTALCHPKVNEAAAVSLFSNDRQMNLCAAALGMLTPLSVS